MAKSAEESPAAALGRMRWEGTTKKHRRAVMTELSAKRTASLTPERRSEIAKKASAAAAKKRTEAAKSRKKAG